MTAEPAVRQRFGRYETLFRIAGGGMAEVYAARALGEGGFQKLVALKRMRPKLAEDARFVTMFLDEGRLAANIASPNVVSTLDLGRADDNSLYLVMELVTGVALSQLIEETRASGSPIPIRFAVDIVAQAASGLHGAHVAKSPAGEPLEIVHRDCSPHNILIDVNGQVKITDFGIAKAMERQTQSHAGEMKGKLCYLSPEQARGLPVDRRTDIFILGIVAWEVLAGRQLFDAENAVEALHKVVSMEIPPLDQVNPAVSDRLSAAVQQALSRDPDERYASAAAFANALNTSLGGPAAPRAELGAFVRAYGGDSLLAVEGGIREALGSGVRARAPLDLTDGSRGAAPSAAPPRREPAATLEAPLDDPDPSDSEPIDVRAASAARRELLGDGPDDARGRASTEIDPRPPTHREPAATRLEGDAFPLTRPGIDLDPAEESAAGRGRARTAPLRLDVPPIVTAPERPSSAGRSARLVVGAIVVALACGGGALGMWMATRPEPAPVTEPAPDPRSDPPLVAAPPRDPAADPDGPSEADEAATGDGAEASTERAAIGDDLEAGEAAVREADGAPVTSDTEPAARVPGRAPRGGLRSRRATTRSTRRDPSPATLQGGDTPVGDRRATFDEIPWQ